METVFPLFERYRYRMISQENSNHYDIVVIGAGPGGYVTAAHAGKLGMRVACIDKSTKLGGTCLNIGCIPSKALLDSSKLYCAAKENFHTHGIFCSDIRLDLSSMMQRKNQIIADLNQQVSGLLRKNHVEIIHGMARLLKSKKIQIQLEKGTRDIVADSIVIATGSEPIIPTMFPYDGKYILTSTDALSLDEVPKHFIIVGGGYIGLELGTIWMRLGSKVTVIEMLPQIASTLDLQISKQLESILQRQGMEFHLQTKVMSVTIDTNSVMTTVQKANDIPYELRAERMLVSVGRKPNIYNLGLEELGIDIEDGRVVVDNQYQTNIQGIYAIGDIIHGPMLAHKASAEAVAVIECITGHTGEVSYDCLPSVVYTWPEVACVGLTEEQAKEQNISYKIATFPFAGVGRACCLGEKTGFIKILAHTKTNRILGVHILGPHAEDLIAECTLAMQMQCTLDDVCHTIHAHPTFSEGIYEAVWTAK